MQVGLATTELNDDDTFERASYGFAVLSIIIPVIAVSLIVLLFVISVLDNLIATLQHSKPRQDNAKANEAA